MAEESPVKVEPSESWFYKFADDPVDDRTDASQKIGLPPERKPVPKHRRNLKETDGSRGQKQQKSNWGRNLLGQRQPELGTLQA